MLVARLLLLGLFLAHSLAFGAVRILKIGATPTQLLIDYVAPNSAACTVKVADMNLPVFISAATGNGAAVVVDTRRLRHGFVVGTVVYVETTDGPSQWNGWQTVTAVDSDGVQFTFANSTAGTATGGNVGQLVHDVNPALFTSADNDLARSNTNSWMLWRQLTVGKKEADPALDGKWYSRALQVASRHHVTLACGSDVAEKDSSTRNIPLGNGGMVEPPRSHPSGAGVPSLPSFDLRCIWDLPGNVAYDRVIEPGSGILHTNGQVCGELSEIRDMALIPYPPANDHTDAFVRSSTGWGTPDNILSNTDGGAAATTTSAGGVLCVPFRFVLMSYDTFTNLPTYGVDLTSVDNLRLQITGAQSSGTANVEANMSFNGCGSAWFQQWQMFDLTGSPSTFNFPNVSGSTTPQSAFGEWRTGASVNDPIPTRVQTLSLRNNNLVSDGTDIVTLPPTGQGDIVGFFHEHHVGATLLIGGSGGDAVGCRPSGGTAGTAYTITEYISPKAVRLNTTVAAATEQYWCIAQWALMLRPTAGTGTISIDYINAFMYASTTFVPDSGGGRGRGSTTSVPDAAGNLGFLVEKDENGIYWVSKDNGESRRVGSLNLPALPGISKRGSCLQAGNSSLASDARKIICNMKSPVDDHAVPVIWEIHWEGANKWRPRLVQNADWDLCVDSVTPSPNPCMTGTPVIDGTGYTLTQLFKAFRPDFDDTKFTGCGIGEPTDQNVVPVVCSAGNQDSLGWIGVLDLDKPISSYDPMDPTTNPIIAGIGPSDVGFMGNGIHSTAMVSSNAMYVGQKPGRTPENTGWFTADGPFVMDLVADLSNATFACPPNYHGYTLCSTLVVRGEAFDPDPWGNSVGTRGEYFTYSIDGALQFLPCASYGSYGWGCTNKKSGITTDVETVRTIDKTVGPSSITYTIARDVTHTGTIKDWTTFDTCNVNTITAGSPGIVECTKVHGLYTGQAVEMRTVGGMTGATGTFLVRRLTETTFELMGSTVTGTYSGGASVFVGIPACSIVAASNTNPIGIECANAHGLANGDSVTIAGIGGNTNANGLRVVTVTGPKTFTIPVAGNGTATYTSICSVSSLHFNNNGRPAGPHCSGGTPPGLAGGSGVIVNGMSSVGVADGTKAIISNYQNQGEFSDQFNVWLMNANANGATYTGGGTLSVMGVAYLNTQLRMLTTHIAENDANPPDAPGVWDYRLSPKGQTNTGITVPATSRHWGYVGVGMSHTGCTPLGGLGGCAGGTDNGFAAYTPYTAATLLAPNPPLFSPVLYAFFADKPALAFPNVVETYVSAGQNGCGTDIRCKFSLNSSPAPYNTPEGNAAGFYSKVPGTTYVYRLQQYPDPDIIWPFYSQKAQWLTGFQGWKPLRNVSSPSVLLTDTLADAGKVCYVQQAGECWPGSKAYEQYVVAANVNFQGSTSLYGCTPQGAKDLMSICDFVYHWLSNFGVRYNWGLHANLRRGGDWQMTGHSFNRGTAGGYSNVPKVFSDGKWYGPLVEVFGPDRIRTKTFYAKVPFAPEPDTVDRLMWIPFPVRITGAPAGTAYAQVEFGYDEFSDFNNGIFRCGERMENCWATAAGVPKPYQALDGIPFGVNYLSDTYLVTAQSPVTIVFPAGHKMGSDTKLSVTGCKNVEITIVDSNHISLNGTTNCQLVGQQPYVGQFRQDSPYQYPSEGCTIASVSNTTPPEIICQKEHHWQTGNTAFISGVGTGINGAWPIEWTGPAAFKLTGAVASGSFFSGTAAPGAVPCPAGVCTVVIPALSNRIMGYRIRYLNSTGRLIALSAYKKVETQ